jgi:release factor glutamine methyltransferase
LPDAVVDLLDIDVKALIIAKTNVDKFTLSLTVLGSDLLAKTTEPYDVLLCNLPYVPDGFQINPAALQEPRLAIFGGPDGLDIYRKLFMQTSSLPHKPLYILTEALPPQHPELAAIALQSGYIQEQAVDFIQQFKYQK